MGINRRIPRLISGLGVLLSGVLVTEAAATVAAPDASLQPIFWVGAGTTVPFLFACLYGGHWLRRSDIRVDRYPRVAWWVVGGIAGFGAINALTMAAMGVESIYILVGWLRWAAALGAGTGALIGLIEGRAIHRAVGAERARVRAEEAETREELLAYLHNLLRHKVRNAVNAIDGHAALLANGAKGEGQHLEAIHRQTGELSEITGEVHTFLEASRAEADLEPMELCAVLQTQLDAVASTMDLAEVELECPGETRVLADDLLHRAFRSILLNATIRDPDEVSHVRVAVSVTAEAVTVRIADDGTGVVDANATASFDLNSGRTPEQGLGLPLGRLLVERYGGEMSLAETGPDGTTITVGLPRATEESPETGRR